MDGESSREKTSFSKDYTLCWYLRSRYVPMRENPHPYPFAAFMLKAQADRVQPTISSGGKYRFESILGENLMQRIVIASGDLNNIGDFALLMQCVQGLRGIGLTQPILVRQWVTPPPDILRALNDAGVEVLSGKNIPTSLKAAMGGLVMIGGGQMVRDNASLKSLAILAAMTETARRTGGRVAVLGCGVSQLRRRAHRILWRQILSSASVLTTRDDASRVEVERLCGAAATPILTADLVFCPSTLHDALAAPSSRTKAIIVAPCDDPSEERGIDVAALAALSIAAAQEFSVETITLVAHDSGPSMDPIVCRRLEEAVKSQVPEIRVVTISSNILRDYTDTYGDAALVITNRLHSAIFSIIAQKPLLILDDGGAKTAAAARYFDVTTVKVSDWKRDAPLARLLTEAANGPPDRRKRQVDLAKQESARNFSLLKAALGARP